MNVVPGGGDGRIPLSISPWQFAQTSTHFFASSRSFPRPFPDATLIVKAFVAGSTWWKCKLMMQRS